MRKFRGVKKLLALTLALAALSGVGAAAAAPHDVNAGPTAEKLGGRIW